MPNQGDRRLFLTQECKLISKWLESVEEALEPLVGPLVTARQPAKSEGQEWLEGVAEDAGKGARKSKAAAE